METKKIIEQLELKLNKDYKDLRDNYWLTEDKLELVNMAYEIATVNNLYDAIDYFIEDYLSEEDENIEFPIENEDMEFLINYNGNILDMLKDRWLNFRHPEDIQFWTDYYAVVNEVVNEIIRYLKKECK